MAVRALVTLEELASKEPSQATAKMALTTTRTGSLIAPIPVVKRPRSAAGVAPAELVAACCAPDVDCDDQNECTEDACNPVDGQCDYSNVAAGTSCDFGGLPGVCGVGACEDAMLCAGVDCDDQNECTTDTCDPANGLCDHANVVDLSACDFGGLPGICTAGVCEDAMLCAGVDCDDGNECTQDACDPMDGTVRPYERERRHHM